MIRSAFPAAVLMLLLLILSTPSLSAQVQRQADARLPQDSGKDGITVGRYVSGGVIGSVFGFGIGHAVVGRWQEKGWVFTAAEGIGLILILQGSENYDADDDDDDGFDDDDFDYHRRFRSESSLCGPGCREAVASDGGSQILLGLGLMIGFHVWEVVDLWKNTSPHVRKAPSADSSATAAAKRWEDSWSWRPALLSSSDRRTSPGLAAEMRF